MDLKKEIILIKKLFSMNKNKKYQCLLFHLINFRLK